MNFFEEVYSSLLWNIGLHLNKYDREIRKKEFLDTSSIDLLPNIGLKYIPWTDVSIDPASIRAILNEIIIHKKYRVIEFGSGISTLFISKIVEDAEKGHVTSIEHDESWLRVVRGYLEKMEISNSTYSLKHVKLTEYEEREDVCEWYNVDRIDKLTKDEKYELVFVDGPVGSKSEDRYNMERYPAMPNIIENMSDDFVIFLDDTKRPGEKYIEKDWCERYKLTSKKIASMSALRPINNDSKFCII